MNLYDINAIISSSIFKIIGAILILLIGIVISKLVSKLFKKLLHKSGFNMILKKALRIDIPVEEFLSTIIKYLLYLVSVIIALQHLGLATFILNAILITILVLLIVFIILALKDLVPNISAGYLLYHRKFLKAGDNIRIKNITGKITEITLTEIKLKTPNGDTVIIPNSIIIKNEVIKK